MHIIIKNRRKALKISQGDMAARLKIGRPYYSKLEGGKAKMSIDQLGDICRILDLVPVLIFKEQIEK